MITLVVLVSAAVVWTLVATVTDAIPGGAVEIAAFSLSSMLVFTGLSHFGAMRTDFEKMVPPWLPRPRELVTVSGLLELAGAAALIPTATRPWAAAGLVALFIALFPANVHAARAGVTLRGKPVTPLIPRTLMQLLFVGLAAWIAVSS